MPTMARSALACSTRHRAIATSTTARLTSAAISAATAAAIAPERRLATSKRPPETAAFLFSVVRGALDHHHLGADLDFVVEVDDVLVAHADAAGRHRLSDRPRFVRSM